MTTGFCTKQHNRHNIGKGSVTQKYLWCHHRQDEVELAPVRMSLTIEPWYL